MTPPTPSTLSRGLRVTEWAALILSSWLVGCFVQLLYRLRYATPLQTDDLIYHLAIPAHWIRNGFAAPFTSWFHEAAPGYSPMLMERLAYFLMLPVASDVLARWLFLPFQLGLGAFTYLILRRMSVRRALALPAAAGSLMFRPFLRQGLSLENDVALTAFFLLAVWGGMALLDRGGRRGWGGLLCGVFLMMGTKYIGLVYGTVLLTLAVFASWWNRRTAKSVERSKGRNTPNFLSCSCIFLCAVVGLHTYTNNHRLTGNPVFPARVSILGMTLLPGLYGSHEVRDYSVSFDFLREMFIDSEASYAMPRWTGLILLCGVVGCWVGMFCGRTDVNRRDLNLVTVVPLLLLSAFLAIVPFGEQRLLFPIYGLMWMAPAVLLEHFARRGSTGAWFACLMCSAWLVTTCIESGTAAHTLTLMTLGMAIVGPLIAAFWMRIGAPQRLRLASYSGLIALLLITTTGYVYGDAYVIRYHKLRDFSSRYGDLGKAWAWLDERTKDHPAVVAWSGTSMTYPLYGSRLQNDVRYVHIAPGNHSVFHKYLASSGDIQESGSAIDRCTALFRTRQDISFWIAEIKREQVEFLFVVRNDRSGEMPIEAEWAALMPEAFALQFDSPGVRIYRIHDPQLPQ